MADGLLGSFDNIMAGLTADDVEALEDSSAGESTSVGTVEQLADDVPDVAPHRVVDPRAQAVADRLLRRTPPPAHDTAIEPVRQGSVVRLVVIADQPDERDDALHDLLDHRTIGDGEIIIIGRGESAVDADPLHLVVPYGVVSRQHCTIARIGDVVSIADTGSANGTVIVRDAYVVAVGDEPVALLNGDIIATAGGHRPFVRFEIDGATS